MHHPKFYSIHLELILQYIILLYCKGHIQMTSIHSTIDVEKANNRVKNVNVTFNMLRIYTRLYYTYRLLYCEGHIQMTNSYSKKD